VGGVEESERLLGGLEVVEVPPEELETWLLDLERRPKPPEVHCRLEERDAQGEDVVLGVLVEVGPKDGLVAGAATFLRRPGLHPVGVDLVEEPCRWVWQPAAALDLRGPLLVLPKLEYRVLTLLVDLAVPLAVHVDPADTPLPEVPRRLGHGSTRTAGQAA